MKIYDCSVDNCSKFIRIILKVFVRTLNTVKSIDEKSKVLMKNQHKINKQRRCWMDWKS